MTPADYEAARKVALWLDRCRMGDTTPAMADVTRDAIKALQEHLERLGAP